MADGVLLLVDAFEGAMPQTRFVTEKALALGLKPIVVINKVDKENCRPDEVHESVFELFFNLGATNDQLDFPTYYGSSKQGWMSTDFKNKKEDILRFIRWYFRIHTCSSIFRRYSSDANYIFGLFFIHWSYSSR
jgi:GTP-binding protein